MKNFLLLLLLAFGFIEGFAQGQLVKGRIIDENNKPLVGATVALKGTTITTSTDESGDFQINTGSQVKPVLVVSFVGYLSEEYAVKGRSNLTIHLQQDIHTLGDVVVVGYGVQRKRDVTGATSTIKADEIVKRPLVKVEQALQGTTSGVVVQQNSGQPGQSISVRIRGANSISGSNEPLYVIDGFIGGSIESLNLGDIESLEVLKDASATAIYGSRGSNGVVLITTKSGKEGKARVDFNPWFSKAEIPKQLKLMNAYQFAVTTNAQFAIRGQAPGFDAAQLESFKTNPGTDWQKELQVKPWIQNYDVRVSGGSPTVKYLFSFNYLDQPGLILNQYYKKAAFRANVDFKLSEKIDLKVYLTTLMPSSRNNSFAGDITDPFAQAYQWDPTSPVRDSTGAFILKSQFGSNGINPVAQLTNQKDDNSSTTSTGTGILTWRIVKGLTFTTNSTYQVGSSFGQSVYGPETAQGLIGADYAQIRSSKSHSFQNSNFLTYHTNFGDHSLTVTALYEQSSGTYTNVTATSKNLSTYSLGYYNLGLGATQQTTSGYSSDALQSFMGRVNYSYKDKYLLTASIRDDGSSHLTEKYSVFPSIGAGWNVGKEDFMKDSKVISDFKIRGSWGITGNQAVPAYATIPQINSGTQGPYGNLGYFYDGSTLSIATLLGAPVASSLKWENDAETNVGLDISFLHNRLFFTADAYHKKITNLLYQYTAPDYLGGAQYARNLGSLENRGIEFSLTGLPVVSGKFRWTTNFNISFNTNKVLDLGGLDSVVLGNVGSAQNGEAMLLVGKPLGAFYGYQFQGTWKTSEAAQAAQYGMVPGDSKYTDLNGDHKYTNADLMVIGNGTPKYSFGFINDLNYGDFTLSIMFQGAHGNQIYSGTFPYTFGTGQGDARNATNVDALNVWTASKETNIPTFSPSSQNSINSSRYVYDASYIKLRNLSLAYNLPANAISKLKIVHSLQIYVSGQNLFCITNYPGYDPEVTNANFGAFPAITQGLETGVIPNPRTYTFGLRVSFQ